jgi:hypothetical protein
MISLERMREIDPSLNTLSDDDLEEIGSAFREATELAFEVYWTKKHGSKNPLGLLQSLYKDTTV